MHFPWWYVPHITAPMLIALVATVHVLVSHYAVGGGLFLAVETAHAYRRRDHEYLGYLRRHAKFFILLTVVFGAITGVGVWWTIGLASPLATRELIHIFVFGWATEWVFFVLEITSAFVFYYCWGRLSERVHVAVGWIYALAAWISLVLITGITAFMLNPGRWPESPSFWTAFFNPQFLPQVLARTGGALLLSSLYVYLHAALSVPGSRLCDLIESRSTRPALLGAVLILLGGMGWYVFLPESAQAVLQRAAALNVMMGLLFTVTVLVFALLYLGPFTNPKWLTPGFAVSLFVLGLGAFSVGEFVREAVRKPFVIYNVVLANQVRPDELADLRESGYLEGGIWTKAYVAQHYPQVMVSDSTASMGRRIDPGKLLQLPAEDRCHLGEVIFQYHCNDCHAVEAGYSAMRPLLAGRSRELILSSIEHLEQTHYFMPPFAGRAEEAELLADYLAALAPPRPEGLRFGPAEEEEH